MGTLIVDIETNPTEWKELPGITRAALTHWIDKADFSEDEKNKKRGEVVSRLSFSPFTATIISLAVYDVERKTGAVYYVSDDAGELEKEDDFTYKVRTEKEILEDFWEGAGSYDVFVTFNGRSFAMPFIHHRSVMLGVKPTVDIARQRYLTKQSMPYHVDLMDELSFYGAMKHRPSLQLLCGAYNIENASLMGGEDIEAAFKEGKFKEIADKNVGDVVSITKLYEKWKENLAPRSFINSLELS